jgi:NitT/TauT family transport system substrate-binding protein
MKTVSAAGAAGILHLPTALAADGPPETTAVRLFQSPSICQARQLIVRDLLRAEGFTDIHFVYKPSNAALNEANVRGEVDFSLHFAPQWVSLIDRGDPVTVLAGVHVGCFDLFGNGDIRSIADLKGRSVGITALGSSEHLLVAVMTAQIGLDPARDIHWVTSGSSSPEALFADGKVDACLGLPPVPQDLRARHIGHLVVNSSVDKTWSQYFCCMLAGNRDFVRHSQGRRPVCDGAAPRGVPTCRWQVYQALRLCGAAAARDSLFVAGIRCRRHRAVLRASAARSEFHQIHSTEDPRRGHRLALPRLA